VQVEEPVQDNGRFIYSMHRSPLCEYMSTFCHRLRSLDNIEMMNKVLENFHATQVLQLFTSPCPMRRSATHAHPPGLGAWGLGRWCAIKARGRCSSALSVSLRCATCWWSGQDSAPRNLIPWSAAQVAKPGLGCGHHVYKLIDQHEEAMLHRAYTA
jgi:hypothetical protein